jgi:bisphosphoglycerate-independent phosphoglycerate mutase (AlkP superfamily)
VGLCTGGCTRTQVSGEYLAKNGIATFACSETQKFGHVTFFWNGNRSGYFDAKLETYLEVGGLCLQPSVPITSHMHQRT